MLAPVRNLHLRRRLLRRAGQRSPASRPLIWLLLLTAAFASSPAVADLRGQSDASLTRMAADWDNLSASDRRRLLSEMQRRMDRRRADAVRQARAARAAGDGAEGQLTIRTERRFGRRVRQADGSVLTISGRVVQKQPVRQPSQGAIAQSPALANPSVAAAARSPARARFGIGFERRSDGRRVVLVPKIVPLTPVTDPGSRPATVPESAPPRAALPRTQTIAQPDRR